MRCSQSIFFAITITVVPYSTHTYTQNVDSFNIARNKIKQLQASKQIRREPDQYISADILDNEQYDFIVVGAGSAGSLIANRLSDPSTGFKVLLLEAGGEPDILTEVPMWSMLSTFTDHNWRHRSQREENFALGLKDQIMEWPRGKGLGGTTLLNYGVHSRGQQEDYNSWKIQGWAYKELLPYFKLFENCKLKNCDRNHRGKGGEVQVEEVGYRTKIAEAFVEAAKNANYTYLADYNVNQILGVFYPQGTTKDGQRCSSERAFLRPIKNRKSLTIYTNCQVSKLLLNEKKRAFALRFIRNGTFYLATVRKEIILSAGTINTPQILMLSGIGPKRELEKLRIKAVHELPVGRKLTDHVGFFGLPLVLKRQIPINQTSLFSYDSIRQLYNEKTGILRMLSGIEALLFTNVRHKNKKIADIELMFMNVHFSGTNGEAFRKSLGVSDEMLEFFKPLNNKHVVCAVVVLLHPKSTGKLMLKSRKPSDHPLVHSGYFTDTLDEDMKTMIAGIREARRILRTSPLDKLGYLYDMPIPSCKIFEFDSDDYWECAVRHLSSSMFHPASTCRMGANDSLDTVVDRRLRVKGITGLRIGDVSILPGQISGHTNVPAFMIGEKLSAMINQEYAKVEL